MAISLFRCHTWHSGDLCEGVSNIQIHRALSHAASAADTAIDTIALTVVAEFVHQLLAKPGRIDRPGIMARGVQGEEPEHATVPGSYLPGSADGLFTHQVEAITGRAHI